MTLYVWNEDDADHASFHRFPHILGLADRLLAVHGRLGDNQLVLVPYPGPTGLVHMGKDVVRLSLREANRELLFYRPGKELRVPVGDYVLHDYQWTLDAPDGKTWYYRAWAGSDSSVLRVREDDEAIFAIGEPFEEIVTVRDYGPRLFRRSRHVVGLSHSIAGNFGEDLATWYVEGALQLPEHPLFVIKDADGKAVHRGQFESG